MAVKSLNTKNLTKDELAVLNEKIKKMSPARLRKFRDGFDEDAMGFSGRKEGI